MGSLADESTGCRPWCTMDSVCLLSAVGRYQLVCILAAPRRSERVESAAAEDAVSETGAREQQVESHRLHRRGEALGDMSRQS